VLAVLLLSALAALSACRTATLQAPSWAFGMNLGEVLDRNTAQPMDALIGGRGLSRVRPPSPHREFTDYALVTERNTGVILGIVGWARFSDEGACQGERAALDEVLRRRYGPGRPADAADRERMRGVPEGLQAPEMTLYPGWQGPVALACSGPRLLLGFWFAKPEKPPAEHAPPAQPARAPS
jgi:hypothetical protein